MTWRSIQFSMIMAIRLANGNTTIPWKKNMHDDAIEDQIAKGINLTTKMFIIYMQ
jgi:hypothetical protein